MALSVAFKSATRCGGTTHAGTSGHTRRRERERKDRDGDVCGEAWVGCTGGRGTFFEAYLAEDVDALLRQVQELAVERDGEGLDAHVVDVVRLVEHHHALGLELPGYQARHLVVVCVADPTIREKGGRGRGKASERERCVRAWEKK